MRYAGSAWRYGLCGHPYAPLAANVLASASPLLGVSAKAASAEERVV
jgi:hypothetical protein